MWNSKSVNGFVTLVAFHPIPFTFLYFSLSGSEIGDRNSDCYVNRTRWAIKRRFTLSDPHLGRHDASTGKINGRKRTNNTLITLNRDNAADTTDGRRELKYKSVWSSSCWALDKTARHLSAPLTIIPPYIYSETPFRSTNKSRYMVFGTARVTSRLENVDKFSLLTRLKCYLYSPDASICSC